MEIDEKSTLKFLEKEALADRLAMEVLERDRIEQEKSDAVSGYNARIKAKDLTISQLAKQYEGVDKEPTLFNAAIPDAEIVEDKKQLTEGEKTESEFICGCENSEYYHGLIDPNEPSCPFLDTLPEFGKIVNASCKHCSFMEEKFSVPKDFDDSMVEETLQEQKSGEEIF